MSERKGMRGELLAGTILIILGGLFLAERFLVFDFGDLIRNYWPSFIIAAGVGKLLDGDGLWNALWLIAVGSWLQAVNLGLWGLRYGNSWPLLLILLGAGMVVRALVESFRRQEERHES